jgi:hypothetical protein
MLPVIYTPISERYLKKLKDKKLKDLFRNVIMGIREDPSLGDAKTGDLKGVYSVDIFYNGKNYELAYSLSKLKNEEVVVIIMAGTRQNFYQEVKRYIK